ncbi:hypothetical protein ANANG_G00164590 [Anguilla anguilla]|uniref:Cadherin domain-containing protein n=1 Tax=Anguilla anguilla TaxID=7936 RepID=A0A9D3M8W6_ANGAN|nr:hypothetical protein ANANG_G00164590 [Anguilla anguilla]
MEDQPAGFVVLYVVARDADRGENGRVSYRIRDGNAGARFSLNPNTGSLTILKALDREEQALYNLTVVAEDHGTPQHSTTQLLSIQVIDVNDEAPWFERGEFEAQVSENRAPGTSVLTVSASDRDQGTNGQVTYGGIVEEGFTIDPVTGLCKRWRASTELLQGNGEDRGPGRERQRPVFSRSLHSLEVPENLEPVALFTLRATDQDAGNGGDVEYRITAGDPAGDFHLDSSSGTLSTARPLDREGRPSYTLTVVAQDRGPAPSAAPPPWRRRRGSPVLAVAAGDADEGENGRVQYFLSSESAGTFAVDQDTGRITVAAALDREKRASYDFLDPLVINVSSGSVSANQVVATMKAEDKDFGANGSVFYRFSSPVHGFAINSLTGQIQVTDKQQALSQSQRTLIVEAKDQGSPAQSSLGVVLVYVKEQEYSGIRFSQNARDVSLQENAATGTAVAQAQAQHPDGSRGDIFYSIFSGNRLQSFSISKDTGEIVVQESSGLDFEDTPRLRLVVKAETASSSSYMAINLILQDVNDNLPRFQLQNYVVYMREAQGYDIPIIQVLADDLDQGQNGQVTYSIKSSTRSGLFRIDPATGSITTAAIMDREIWTQTKLVVTATDRGNPRLAGQATLTVIVVDLNDNSPTIPLPREIRVAENTLIGTEITQVTGNDVDSGPALSYSLQLDAHSQGKFGIHRYGGGVSLTAPLDFEERTWYTLTVRASDSRHQSEANLTVLVEDVNDNAPVFTQDLYQVTLPEHSPPGSPVITVTATDRDSGDNGKVTYRVMSSSRDGFYIDPNNGTLFINQETEFDPERPSVTVVIEARDSGTPALSSVTTVQVQLSDVNDNAPTFHQSEYRATVSEDGLPGATILTLEAADGDPSRENCGFDFAIASGNAGNAFQIESSVRFLEGRGFQTVGTLILAERLDFESAARYNLTVVVSDRGVPQRSSSVPAVITVTDADDNAPAFGRAEYALRDETGLFTVDQWTGALRLRAAGPRTPLLPHGRGPGLRRRRQLRPGPVTVEVKDVNDNKPYFPLDTLTASLRENQPPNAPVTVLHAIDHDTGVFGQLRYYMAERSGDGTESFSVNQTSGEVRSRLTFDFEKLNSFSFVAVAVDTGNYSATVTVQVYVTGEDEYDPLFTSPEFSFEVPEGAQKGQSIGQVQASDEDGGVDGIVLYSLPGGSPYFDINATTGVVFLKMDSSASSPSPWAPSSSSSPPAAALCLVRSRRRRKKERQGAPAGTALQKLDDSKTAAAGGERIYHQTLPGTPATRAGPAAWGPTPGGSLDPSHSSGRGSAEAAEDDEIG